MFAAKQPVQPSLAYHPLSVIPAGAVVRVHKITGGVRMMHTLAQSGIVYGIPVQVLRNDWGRLILSVYDRRVALNRDVAYNVMVCYPESTQER